MNDWRLVTAGDVGFVSNTDWNDRWIQWAERRKYGKNSREARYNHCFLLDSSTTVLEATPKGVMLDQLSDYNENDVLILRPPYADDIARWAAVHAMGELLNTRYGWLTIACEALTFLTGTRLRFGIDMTVICSGAVSYAVAEGGIDVRAPLHPKTSAGLVAGALDQAGVELGTDIEFNSPADVAAAGFRQRWTVIQTAPKLDLLPVVP